MPSKSNATITMQELRKDPLSFLRQVNSGKTLTVVYHSRVFATVKSAKLITDGPEPKGAQHYISLSKQAQKSAAHVLNPNKSIKELYAESIAQKHDISRR